MTPRLFVRPAARTDLDEAFAWYQGRSAGLGFEFLRAVEVALAAIERGPEQFAVVVDDIRKARVRRFPYLVHFVMLDQSIAIIAVMLATGIHAGGNAAPEA